MTAARLPGTPGEHSTPAAPPAGGHLPSDVSRPPRRIPREGAVLRLRPDQWQSTEPRPLILLVEDARPEISLAYGGDWVWVSGIELMDGALVGRRRDVLVHVDAIPGGDAARGHGER